MVDLSMCALYKSKLVLRLLGIDGNSEVIGISGEYASYWRIEKVINFIMCLALSKIRRAIWCIMFVIKIDYHLRSNFK